MARAWGMYVDFKEDSITDALNFNANLINTKVLKTSILGDKYEYVVFSRQGGVVLCRSENVEQIEDWLNEKVDEVFGSKQETSVKKAEFIHS